MNILVCASLLFSLAISSPIVHYCNKTLSNCDPIRVGKESHRFKVHSSFTPSHTGRLEHRSNPDFRSKHFKTHAISRRSQSLTAEQTRNRCPPLPSCPTCPIDWRCERRNPSFTPLHKSAKLPRPQEWYHDPAEPSALIGSQLAHHEIPRPPGPEDTGENQAAAILVEDKVRGCPLERCDTSQDQVLAPDQSAVGIVEQEQQELETVNSKKNKGGGVIQVPGAVMDEAISDSGAGVAAGESF
ncbi:hypothetical protein B0J11DRAFT_511153 [Dendryphion nanum]|uniref:Uncharacterized protein n=1 Tax=Dendryphion nanum TaxID=256645 RepID=A0A9P9IC77_9PLEO|nr:hypothetical protein B0J11DRAFT_511153 [Dendryphion nanum]